MVGFCFVFEDLFIFIGKSNKHRGEVFHVFKIYFIYLRERENIPSAGLFPKMAGVGPGQ